MRSRGFSFVESLIALLILSLFLGYMADLMLINHKIVQQFILKDEAYRFASSLLDGACASDDAKFNATLEIIPIDGGHKKRVAVYYFDDNYIILERIDVGAPLAAPVFP